MARILLSIDAAEAEELYRFLEHQYISPTSYPRINRLWNRIGDALHLHERRPAAAPPPAATA